MNPLDVDDLESLLVDFLFEVSQVLNIAKRSVFKYLQKWLVVNSNNEPFASKHKKSVSV